MYYIYILLCADKTFYVGHAENLDVRLDKHNSGFGARYTAVRRPLRLVYYERLDSLALAVQREKQIKRWSRAKKQALIAQNFQRLKQLSQCQGASRMRA